MLLAPASRYQGRNVDGWMSSGVRNPPLDGQVARDEESQVYTDLKIEVGLIWPGWEAKSSY